MNEHRLWNLAGEALAAIRTQYEPVIERIIAESGLDGWTWGLLLSAFTFEPESTTPARLQIRGPYTAVEAYLARLSAAAGRGYLAEASPGEYRLTDAGRAGLERFIEEARAAMSQADPLPQADGARLAGLFDRLVQSSLRALPPPEPRCIRLNYKLMPAVTPPLPYIEEAISCLNAYRDDAHVAAWQPSGLSATALESLTLLWRGEADSLDAVCQRLAHRGHPPQVYAEALAELRARGFIEGPEGTPHVTEAGRVFRDQVEADTDRYFFAPWSDLDDAEKAELADLLTRLRDGLKGKVP
ncbi:MAG: hypothetical protein AB1566_00960 [Chloroflexota bacterium]